jgi:hypothetical protein
LKLSDCIDLFHFDHVLYNLDDLIDKIMVP